MAFLKRKFTVDEMSRTHWYGWLIIIRIQNNVSFLFTRYVFWQFLKVDMI